MHVGDHHATCLVAVFMSLGGTFCVGYKKKKKGILPDCVWVKLFLVLQLI